MDKVIKFLSSQKLLSIAVTDSNGPWIANVYFVCSEAGVLYFVSPKSNRHSRAILANSKIAFSSAWFNPAKTDDRKAIQGTGNCFVVTNPIEIAQALNLLHKSFPEFKDRITFEWICENVFESKVWKIQPTYLKYWDDELYGEDEFIEENVSRET